MQRNVIPAIRAALSLCCFAASLTVGCHSADGLRVGGEVGDTCGGTAVCAAPLVCEEGICVDPSAFADAGDGTADDDLPADDDSGDDDAPADDDGGDDDAPVDDDAPADDDSGDDDAPADDDDDDTPAIALRDYPSCDRDSDCAVGRGRCVTELDLNRAFDGQTSVAIRDLFPDLTKQGICTDTCSKELSTCQALKLRDSSGVEVSYGCQLVYAAESPYDASATLPFPVDEAELSEGVAFGALCRPPIGLGLEVSTLLCGDCTNSAQCGDGICWDFVTEQAGVGSCLPSCDAGTCPVGFDCRPLGGGDHCVPVEGTCGACRDRDGDGRGVGACDPDGLATAVDCDDANALAYFDADEPEHAFPEHCGEFDYNCNGLSDADEQTSAEVYPEEHCGACDTPCTGELGTAVDNQTVMTATAECRPTGDDQGPEAECAAKCEPGWADCDGVLENGCEVSDTDAAFLYFFDADGDGDGDPNWPRSFCDGAVEDGYVETSGDCDDEDDQVYGGAAETCDGKDNDCNDQVDDGVTVQTYPDLDQDGYGDATAAPLLSCPTPGRVTNNQDCDDGDADVHPGATEVCDGKDNDCVGGVDDGAATPPLWYPDADADGDGNTDTSLGVSSCTQPAGTSATHTDCNDGDPEVSGLVVGESCDGKDNDCNGSTDEGFPVGNPCDGPDESDCESAVYTCSADGAAVECNEDVWEVRDGNGVCQEQCRHFVKVGGGGSMDGSSWENAYAEVQQGIDAAAIQGCVVWVARGTYRPTHQTFPSSPRWLTFNLLEGVKLYGGFAGTERYLSERNLSVNETILSGDVGTPGENIDNSYHVVRMEDYDDGTTPENTVLDGFTMSGGRADGGGTQEGDHEKIGGGLYLRDGGAPAIRNCTFRNNLAHTGGAAAYVNQSTLEFSNCTFENNVITSTAPASSFSRAAVYGNNSAPSFEDCVFRDNSSLAGTAEARGGAIYLHGYRAAPGSTTPLPVNITRCTFSNNHATLGGAISTPSGSVGGPLVIHDSDFENNTADHGGAVHTRNLTITNSRFSGNSADYGGGLYVTGGPVDVSTSSFVSNAATSFGAGAYFTGLTGTVQSSCFGPGQQPYWADDVVSSTESGNQYDAACPSLL